MKLPNLKLRLVPDERCIRCGQLGYVAEKAQLCGACLNISLLKYAKRRKQKQIPATRPPVTGPFC